ncbi:MAG: chromosomal replication initiator protein DnaA [Sulfuricurvum sp.]|uniref:chromosomal replication initiator protein DnaA n=1 Tax=Sulfuricurvum sp. TaxID=2025608 RepID=UPI002629E1CB|nr:chromosomal replication initiator protein DnaA [Sulfuricurvum sp.]MDD2368569.1 chromosomal replication initiator protein DnaA [Sulfuricurvum sp.]MDD2949329.1 chromosomal replication initiator protein DnaA [Sulfuricurvum sp.]MDD5117150.1 chromosomal replication initiator protein DnaA [Sulfuricurvum sp.]
MNSIGIQVLNALKNEINEIDYKRYIKQLTYDEAESKSNLAVFRAPNALIANWVRTKFADKIAHLFEIKTNVKPTVSILVQSVSPSSTQNISTPVPTERPGGSLLNPSYTFQNFVVGGSNEFAYGAAKSVSEKPGIAYNPLFLYGGVGLGKTHLMQSVGNVMLAQGKTVIYTSVEQFLNDFTRHLSNRTMDRFKDKYRKCDLLLIDDIQFLSNKNQIQEEFFHTFDALRNENKQIIITSDKPPKKIGGLEERLKSRFESGLVADIQPPELETKIEIIKKKCEINRVKLDRDVINYVATIIENNTREIEGILSKLNAYSQLMGVDITIEFARNVLKEQMAEKRSNITTDLIMDTVAKELNIKPSEIRSKSRNSNIVYARRIAIYLARSLTPNSMPQLAQYFGMKDHTAVSHTMKKIQELMKNDEDFRVKVEELSNKVSMATSE